MIYNDGKRIYINRLIFYPLIGINSVLKPSMISLGQLFFKDLGIDDGYKFDKDSKQWRKPEVECCILHTMVYEEALIEPLIRTGIPITVFKDSP